MSRELVKQLPLLELLVRVNKSSREKILKHSDPKLIKVLVDCIHNVLVGNVSMKKERIKRLKKHKSTLRRIVNGRGKVNTKKKLIVQRGSGFLPILLEPIVSYLLEKIVH